jgi:signal transduction histidine kinase
MGRFYATPVRAPSGLTLAGMWTTRVWRVVLGCTMPRMATVAGRTRWRALPASLPSGGRAAATLVTAVAVSTLAFSIADAKSSPLLGALPDPLMALGVLAGLLLAASAWVTAAERPSVSAGIAVASIGLGGTVWAGWTTLPDAAQAVALAIAPLAVAGAAGVGIAWSRRTMLTPAGAVIIGLVLTAVAVRLAAYDPIADPGCVVTCVHVRPVLAGLVSTRAAFLAAGVLEIAAAAIAVVALALGLAAGRARLVLGASLLAVVVLTLPVAVHAWSWTATPSDMETVLPGLIAGLLLGGAPLLAVMAARRIRREVRELVEALATGWSADSGGSLIHRVEFAVPGEGRWVDPAGGPVDPTSGGRRFVVVSDAAGPAFRLEVAGGADAEAVLATVTPATLLALRNARLAAVRAVRLEEVRASQRRIVSASDDVRRRIERDLHDGAQQRLVSVSLQLSLAGRRLAVDDPARELVATAEAHVHSALERLRQLGHGIFPMALEAEGLPAALEDLGRTSDVDVVLDVPPLELDRDVALAAYSVVDAALAMARVAGPAAVVHVSATADGGQLELRVGVDGAPAPMPGAFTQASDRVGAVGGRLAVEAAGDHVAIVAVMPCGS